MVAPLLTAARIVGGGGSVAGILAGARIVSGGGGAAALLLGARIVSGQPLVVDLGTPQTVDPGDRVTFTADTEPPGATVTSWEWQIMATSIGAAPALTAAGASVSFVMPGVRDPAGVTVTLKATAHLAGQADSTATTTAHAPGHNGPWHMTPTGQIEALFITIPGTATVTPPVVVGGGGVGIAPLGTSPLGV